MQGGSKEVGEGSLRSRREGWGDRGSYKEREGNGLAENFLAKWSCANPEN